MDQKILPIKKIAQKLSIKETEIALFGEYKAKIKLNILDRIKNNKPAKYINVTAITPTPFGEGKTTTTIGLSMALNKIGKKTIATIRQPSLGPVFGIKGGGAGGGKAKLIPYEDINLHFTGDTHSVSVAHNLCAAFLDNSLFRGNKLNIDLKNILWKRVVDVNDRALRNIEIGLGDKTDGIKRNTGFDITAASEIMAILAMSKNISDLRKRLDKIVVAFTKNKQPVFAKDLKVSGAMAVLLKDALMPNLVQTNEHTPAIVHTGPFANIAHGNSSIIADLIATKLSDYVVTESGFGADCGLEKFVNIKCRYSGLHPDCVVIVCSIRALKMHSGIKLLPENIKKENLNLVEQGLPNLEKQIQNVTIYGIPAIVVINRFDTDTDRELLFVQKKSIEFGASEAIVTDIYLKGSNGGLELATAVIRQSNKKSKLKFLYSLDLPIKEKIEIIATKIYGAKCVKYSSIAEEKIRLYKSCGWDKLPICMAKTHLSLSHEPNLKGKPQNFVLPVVDIRPSIGAGFLYPLCGQMRTMPGLPREPVGERVDIDKNGNIIGLF